MQEQTQPSGFGRNVVSQQQLYDQFLQDRKFTNQDELQLGLKLLTPDETYDLLGQIGRAHV